MPPAKPLPRPGGPHDSPSPVPPLDHDHPKRVILEAIILENQTMLRYLLPILWLLPCLAGAANRHVELAMQYRTVNLAGKPVRAVTVNGSIPGPELRFTEGDDVELVLKNELDEPGAIHWHGLLVPWTMDGVPWVSMPPIPPGGSFTYRFTLRQSGTYWYHAHSKLHEQQGLYGAIVVQPRQAQPVADHDYTVLLSDWSNTDPETIFHNLKKDGDYYKRWRPSWAFFLKAWRKAPDAATRQEIVRQGRDMQSMRMGNWDWSDVAYDAFLANGKPPSQPWTAAAKPGETVRLRLINGGASTYFKIKLHGIENFSVIAADGQAVEPVDAQRLLMGMAETYDILFTMPTTPIAVYAEALDGSGAALAIIRNDPGQALALADIPRFDDPMFSPMDMDMEGMDMGDMPPPTPPGQLDYSMLRSVDPTGMAAADAETITLHLTGNMSRYIWSFNGVRFQDAQPIEFIRGHEYRLVLVNDTMMHHPIHIHGHWFILENGQEDHSPRKHTIDVPPMQTVIARVRAQESGQWFFHCHNLYHMMAGMTREIHYHEHGSTP